MYSFNKEKSNNFIAFYGESYHTGSEFKLAEELENKVIVTIPIVHVMYKTVNKMWETHFFSQTKNKKTARQFSLNSYI